MSINRVVLSGNLTRDAELRHTDGGLPILAFSIAFNDRRHNADSETWEDIPNFADCTLFGNRAEALATYLLKGTKVAIDGKLRWNAWETEEGDKRSKLEIIVNDLEFMTHRKDEEE